MDNVKIMPKSVNEYTRIIPIEKRPKLKDIIDGYRQEYTYKYANALNQGVKTDIAHYQELLGIIQVIDTICAFRNRY